MPSICLVTPHHISFQPRVLREADTLCEAGHQVRIVGRQVDPMLAQHDRRLAQSRQWRLQAVDLQSNGSSRPAWFVESLRSEVFRRGFDAGIRTAGVGSKSYLRGFTRLQKLAEAERSDWFIAHTQAALPVAAAAAFRWRTKLGFDCEDLLAELGCDPPEIVRLIERKYLPLCDYVSVPSQEIAERLIEQYSIKPPIILYNVFPLKLTQGMSQPVDRAGSDALRLHWFGQTIGTGRGLEDVIKAATIVGRKIEIHLRGRVSDDYRSHLESLAANALQLKLNFHPLVNHDDMFRTMDQFDVGLALEDPANTGYALTVTNKLFGYLLSGLAIAATNTPGQREILHRIPESGFLYPSGNPELLAQGLRRWIDDRSSLTQAQQTAWDAARTEYCWDLVKEGFLSTLENRASARDKTEAVAG